MIALIVFIATLGAMLSRPRGLNEAWSAAIGAVLMLATLQVTPSQSLEAMRGTESVLLFLLGLLFVAVFMDRSGFFDWAAALSARAARGSGHKLYRNLFFLGAAITALMSLDTTAVILTPVVIALVHRLDLPERPFLLACAFVANTASLILPVSNLTNLMFHSAFRLRFDAFVAIMLLPQIGCLAVNYGLFVWLFRKEIKPTFPVERVVEPAACIKDLFLFRASLLVALLALFGYFVASLTSLPTYAVALSAAAVLAVCAGFRRQLNVDALREVPWALFPFVLGLAVIVRGVENLSFADSAVHFVQQGNGSLGGSILASTVGAGIGSNLVNNIPMALLSISTLHAAHAGCGSVYGALLGCNLGPNLTITGSLATMLVISSARKRGIDVGAGAFLRVGLVVTPVLLLVGSGLLWVSLAVLR